MVMKGLHGASSGVSDALAVLGRHPYFAALPASILAAVGRRVAVRACAKGALVFGEGEPGHGLYLVASGLVRVFKSSEDGREQVLHHMAQGRSFNDVAAFDGGPCPASAQAVEPSTILVLRRDDLLELMRSHPEIALAVVRELSARLRQMSGLVEHLALRGVVARVAGELARLSTGGATVQLPTRQELAAMVGTVREVATRALLDLERRGIVRLGPSRRATILDRAALQRLSGSLAPASSPPGARPAS